MKMKLLRYPSLNTDLATLLLRWIVGGLFVYHGYTLLKSYHEILPMFKDIIGIGSKLSFNLLIFAELVCGFLVAIGFLTRISIIPILISMIVGFFFAHAKDNFQVKELAFLFMLLSLVIFVLGSGKFSVDRLLFKK